jgi:inward rectifier potassium channel
MFRVVNPQSNQLLEVEVTVTLSLKRENSELRDFHLLELERGNVIFFPSLWTIVHPIADESPLHGLTKKHLFEKDVEFIIMIKAFDESFSQTVYSRSSYKPSEVRWGEKFVYVNKLEKNGISIDVSRISETEKAALKN